MTESIKIDIILTPYKQFIVICEIHQLFEAATAKNQHFSTIFVFSGEKKNTIYEILGQRYFIKCKKTLVKVNQFWRKFAFPICVKASNFG